MMRRIGILALLLAAACADSNDVGGITAHLVFADHPGLKRSALRTAQLPQVVDRLQILALDTDGSTLAETNLWASPADGEQQLIREGGTWELSKVKAGDNRTVLAKAYLGAMFDSGLAFRGRRDGITVRVGEIADAGVITLEPTPNRIPEADFDPPASPDPVAANPIPEGEALRVTIGLPQDEDTAGYFLAIGTATAADDPPMIDRGRVLMVGEELTPGLQVVQTWSTTGPQIVELTGLVNGERYGIVVYAYDPDRQGFPLNYSLPATTIGIPADSVPPSAPALLTVTPEQNGARIAFVAPGEDDMVGTPARYEVRAAPTRAEVENGFDALPAVMPPMVQTAGATVAFSRSYADLGVPVASDFWVGVRAVDATPNFGPIAVAMHTVNATLTPTVDRIVPHIAIAGLEVQVEGTNFGFDEGTAELMATETATLTYPLLVTQWNANTISVALPANARSGVLMIRRPDGMTAGDYLTVIQRTDDLTEDYELPFELVGAGTTNELSIAALYREINDFTEEGAIERIYDDVNENMPFVPFVQAVASTALAGTYSPSYDRFMFVASHDTLAMTTAFVTSSTVTPDPIRQPAGVAAGGADGVAAVFLDGGVGGNAPAMIAFTLGGTIRTATVADAPTQPFNAFYATTSTVESYENVTMTRNTAGEILMAYRTVTGTVAELSLRLNTAGGPDDFNVVKGVLRPRAGPNIRVISVPTILGGPENFVVAYEELNDNGDTDVRLLRLSEYGTRLGYAPFTQIVGSRRLDDVGLVVRNGQVWLAVAATRVNGSAELSYAELPATGINNPDDMRGLWPGVVLDSAPADSAARLGCKPFVQRACPMVWLGDATRVFFLRR